MSSCKATYLYTYCIINTAIYSKQGILYDCPLPWKLYKKNYDMSLLCSLFISCIICPWFVLFWCFSPFFLYSIAVFSPLLLYSLDVFLLFSCTLFISYFSDEVWACVVLLQPWLQPPKKRILIMRESPPHRISTTPLLNSEEKEKGEGEGGVTTTWRRIHSGNNLFHSIQHWKFGVTVVFESHLRRYRLIQSCSMVVERLAAYFSFHY